jgi:SAM-dependent methyltransferase
MDADRTSHWNAAYAAKGETGVSWFEDVPRVSLALIRQVSDGPQTRLIDIGGGASRLVDALLLENWTQVSVLDISPAAIEAAMARLGAAAEQVSWIVDDVTRWQPRRIYDIWHDRAAFHFLTAPGDRAAYVERLRMALKPGGHAIIATFALDGPERCSGLEVLRYDPQGLAETIGSPFTLVHSLSHIHTTPWGTTQAFQFSVLKRGAAS